MKTPSHLPLVLLIGLFLVEPSLQDSATDVECPLCANPNHVPQDLDSIFFSGVDTVSCETAYNWGPLQLPEENCTYWQSRGELICQCAENPPAANNCTLCEDGSDLPYPMNAGTPGRICAQLQADAKRDEVDMCSTWQKTMGVYCGCENPIVVSEGVCRLCGADLETPAKEIVLLVDGNETTGSCGQLEFEANLPGADCGQFQELYGDVCCPDITDDVDDDGGVASFSNLAARCAFIMLVSVFVL